MNRRDVLQALRAGRPAPAAAGSGEARIGRYFSPQEYDALVAAHASLLELADAAEEWIQVDNDRARQRIRDALAGIGRNVPA